MCLARYLDPELNQKFYKKLGLFYNLSVNFTAYSDPIKLNINFKIKLHIFIDKLTMIFPPIKLPYLLIYIISLKSIIFIPQLIFSTLEA